MLYTDKKGILCHLLSGFSGFSYSSEGIMISCAKSGLYKAHSGGRMVLAGRSRGCSSGCCYPGTACKWILSWTTRNSYTDCCPMWKAKNAPHFCISHCSAVASAYPLLPLPSSTGRSFCGGRKRMNSVPFTENSAKIKNCSWVAWSAKGENTKVKEDERIDSCMT